jgi:hypothetical protein
MDSAKSKLFQELKNGDFPIGLAGLGLCKKNIKKNSNRKKIYPSFFKFDKVLPVGI